MRPNPARTFTAEEATLMRGPNAPLADVIASFLIAQSQLSPRTLDGYAKNLRAFDRWLGGGRLADVELEALRAVHRRHAAARSLRRALLRGHAESLRILALVARAHHRPVRSHQPAHPADPASPAAGAERRRPWRDPPRPRAHHAARAPANAPWSCLLGTAIRSNEARELALEDVHVERPVERSSITIRAATSKANESRAIRLDPLAAAASDLYARDWRPDRPGPLFLTEAGKPFTSAGWSTYLGRISDRMETAGVRDFMAHRCRHTWATLYHHTGAGTLYDLQAEGGWRDLEMPRHYVKDRPFAELQRIPTPLSTFLRRAAG